MQSVPNLFQVRFRRNNARSINQLQHSFKFTSTESTPPNTFSKVILTESLPFACPAVCRIHRRNNALKVRTRAVQDAVRGALQPQKTLAVVAPRLLELVLRLHERTHEARPQPLELGRYHLAVG